MTPKRSFLWRLLSILLIGSGIVWAGYLLVTTVQDPLSLIPDSMPWLTVATCLVALSVAMNIFIFEVFLNYDRTTRYPLKLVVRLQLIGQLLRYLPGRIWGITYQITTTRELIPALRVTRANLDFMLFSLLGSPVVATLILGYRWQWPWWMLIGFGIGCLTLMFFLFMGGMNWIINTGFLFIPKQLRTKLALVAQSHVSWQNFFLLIVWFLASWVCYAIGWDLLGRAFSTFKHIDFITLCAFYSLASVVGMLAAITPAGLGVREAVFILLANGSLDYEAVAFFALFGRIWLLTIDIILILAALPLMLTNKEKYETPSPL